MQILVTNMFKIELENRDFRKSLCFYNYIVGAAPGRWHFIVDAEKMGCGRLLSANALICITTICLKMGVLEKPLPDTLLTSRSFAKFKASGGRALRARIVVYNVYQ